MDRAEIKNKLAEKLDEYFETLNKLDKIYQIRRWGDSHNAQSRDKYIDRIERLSEYADEFLDMHISLETGAYNFPLSYTIYDMQNPFEREQALKLEEANCWIPKEQRREFTTKQKPNKTYNEER